MTSLVLAVAPFLEMGGRIAAIIICLFVFILVIITVAFNLGMTFLMGWVREKAELVKRLRPYVDSLNTDTEAATRGIEPLVTENPIIRAVASVPAQVQDVDKKVEHATDSVANAVIEFHARTTQVKAVVRAFFLPGLTRKKSQHSAVDAEGLEFKSPGYRMLMEDEVRSAPRAAALPAERVYRDDVTPEQLRNVHSR